MHPVCVGPASSHQCLCECIFLNSRVRVNANVILQDPNQRTAQVTVASTSSTLMRGDAMADTQPGLACPVYFKPDFQARPSDCVMRLSWLARMHGRQY